MRYSLTFFFLLLTLHLNGDTKLFHLLQDQSELHTIVEFGIGENTPWLINHFSEGMTADICPTKRAELVFSYFYFQCNDSLHWKFHFQRPSKEMRDASLLLQLKKDPTIYDATYLLQYKDFCDELFENKVWDIAFVHPSVNLWGDLIMELFDRVKVIIANNTLEDCYGWYRIHTPSNYHKVVWSDQTIWVHEEEDKILQALGVNPKSFPKKHLKIFTCSTHISLTASLARALHYLGHTLQLAGSSFNIAAPNAGVKVYGGTHLKEDPQQLVDVRQIAPNDWSYTQGNIGQDLPGNIEVIENDEIFSNPPDVILITAETQEEQLFELWQLLRPFHDVKLVHYAGNVGVPYTRSIIKNLIALDAVTEQAYLDHHCNRLLWIPWLNYDELPFEGINDSLNIHSYLQHHYTIAFPQGKEIYETYTRQFCSEFPEITFSNLWIPSHSEFLDTLSACSATIHAKDSEGFGYTILECLSRGKPVFLPRKFCLERRLMNWCIEGKTALFFDTYEEFREKLHHFLNDAEYRHALQISAAQSIRRFIDNEKQARILDHFLQTLQ
ncbi:MAG: hypothetical protein K940chlam2_00573 [Chlamydiae bacterium]|nr:hypothetical protein [Chlamydiota bacterium]